MRRDMELLREMLLFLQEASPDEEEDMYPRDFPDREPEEYYEHLVLLREAKLIGGSFRPWGQEIDVRKWSGLRLTWQGQEFIGLAGDPQLWAAAKQQAGERFTSLPLKELTALLTKLVRKEVGL